MKYVAYCRVSTKDQGQDPRRQEDVLRAWAASNGHEIAAVVLDDGTSGSTTPLQRQAVIEAIELAKEHEAVGLVIESVDRWARGGVEDFFASTFTMRIQHGLEVNIAQTPVGMPRSMVAVFHAMQAAGAEEYKANMVRQIKAGLERAKRMGWPKGEPGRKPKPPMTEQEAEMALGVLEREGKNGAVANGYLSAANVVSKSRGAFDLADPKRRQQATVSSWWVRTQLGARVEEMPHLASRVAAIKQARRQVIQEVASGGSKA